MQVLQRPGRKRAAAKSSGGAKPEPQTSDATVVVLPRRSARPLPGTLPIYLLSPTFSGDSNSHTVLTRAHIQVRPLIIRIYSA